MAAWTEEETMKLIEIWSEDSIQAMLEGSRRNKGIFVRIAKEMEKCGFKKTGEQCSCKIKKLRFEYKKIKDTRGKTGRGRKEWKYFEPMDELLGHKPATQPPVVIESGESSLSLDPELTTSPSTTLSSSILHESEDDMLEESEVVDRAIASSSRERDVLPRSRSVTPAHEQGGIRNSKRKRGSDRFEHVESLIEKMVKLQEESDGASRRMEEKLLEMEERRQRENREFQLQMMAVLTSGQAQVPSSYFGPYNNSVYPFMPPPPPPPPPSTQDDI